MDGFGVTRSPCPTEFEEGLTFVAYLRLRGLKFSHIPNETGHDEYSKRRAVRMKQSGTSKGFVDYVVVLPGIGLACIELKRLHGSRTSPEQLEWVEALNSCPGTEARICRGAAECIEFIEQLSPLPTVDKQVRGGVF